MSKNNRRKRRSQDRPRKPLAPKDLHPELLCDIEPDTRPSWPDRKDWPSKPLTIEPILIEVGLFDTELIQFLQDLDELE